MKENKVACYSLNISNKYDGVGEARKYMKKIYQILKYLIETNEQYFNMSFLIGISNVSSKKTKITFAYNNKKGRPRKVIIGEQIPWHIHLFITSSNGLMSTFCDDAKKRLQKKGLLISKSRNDNMQNAIHYVNRQCTYIWKFGKYFESKKK